MNCAYPFFSSGARPLRWRFRIDFFWISGLVIGILFWRAAGPLPEDSVCQGIVRPVPGALFFTAVLFPAVVSVLALCFPFWAIPAICFVKAFLLAYCSMVICAAFGQAGWLCWLLLMFSDILLCPVFYSFWLQVPSSGPKKQAILSVCVFCFSALVGWIDYCMVLPFSATLIEGCL